MNGVIQELVLPSKALFSSEDMYVRIWNSNAVLLQETRKIEFSKGGRVSFDTYHNSLTVDRWTKLEINKLFCQIVGNGKFRIRIGLHVLFHSQKWLQEEEIEIQRGAPVALPILSWDTLDSGMLYCEITALSEGEIKNIQYITDQKEKDIKLGIVITHFNRSEWVVPALQRIEEELFSDEYYAEKISLYVVDNSANLNFEESNNIRIIKNKNYGGSGGFTRGLLELKDNNFDYCLFMDDDATCEIESIKRTFNYFKFCENAKIAISGALLRDIEPYRLFEKGAQFKGQCRPLKLGLDVRNVNDLLSAELQDEKIDYGGWWFFAFNIENVSEFPFPFFVRGDDSRFSMCNDFEIITMNGVSVWAEDFALKSGPITHYYDTRYHLMHQILLNGKNRFYIAKYIMKSVVGQTLSFNYSSARAITQSVNDFTSGSTTFSEDLDSSVVRSKIGKLSQRERLVPIRRSDYDVVYSNGMESRITRLARHFSLNGHLVPKGLLSDRIIFQHKGYRANIREVWKYKKIYYEYEPLRIGYVAERNIGDSFVSVALGLLATFKFILYFRSIADEYKCAVLNLTKESYWRNVYDK